MTKRPTGPGAGRLPTTRRLSLMTGAMLACLAAASAPAWANEIAELPDCTAGAGERLDTSRIVSIGGTVTEILYDLGAGDSVVAVDTTSLYPPGVLGEKPNVGYMRALSAEGVLSMSPTLLMVAEGAGPPNVIDVLKRASVPFVTVSDEATPAAVVDRIWRVGRVVCREEAAADLAARVEARFADLERATAGIDEPQRVLFVMAMQNGRPMVGGTGTAADAIIRLAGAENAAGSLEGYKPMSDEAVLEAAPHAVLMMDSGSHASADVLSGPAFRLTPAAETDSLLTMNGLLLLGFGPRTPMAAARLAEMLYPGIETGEAGTEP